MAELVDGCMTQHEELIDKSSIVVTPIQSCTLGEGLHWDSSRQCLWGVDIHAHKAWRWELNSVAIEQQQLAQRIGWILPVYGESIKVVLGLQSGVFCADANDLSVGKWLQRPFISEPSMRLNDAKADASGAIWCGSLNNDNESLPYGCLYRLSPDGQWQIKDAGYTVANGPAIDSSQTIFMHTDSGRRTIYRFDLDVDSGTLSNKRVWKIFNEAEGYPDGMCFDAEGGLWVAHWGGGRISRFSIDGSLLREIYLPTSHITNVCFGGAGLDRLFVSSAKSGLTPEELAEQPFAGHVFEVLGHGVCGIPSLSASVRFAALY
jgi:xylono-1,5-lactonase